MANLVLLASSAVLVPAALLAATPALGGSLERVIARFECDLVSRLERIHAGDRSTSRNRYLSVGVVGRPGFYVQCIFEPGDRALFCEAASGAYQAGADAGGPPAPPGQAAVLRALGFKLRPGRNHEREIPLDDLPDFAPVARLLLTTLHDAFDARPPVQLNIDAPYAPGPLLRPDACLPVS